MIAQSTIEAVKALDIVSVIGNYVESLKKKGSNYFAVSPFNPNEKHGSFSISPSKQIWKCFSTGKGGTSAINFLMELKSLTYPEAIEEIAKSNNIAIDYEQLTEEQERAIEANKKKKELREKVLPWALSFYANQKFPSNFKKFRQLTDAHIDTFQLGYTGSDRKEFTESALKQYSIEELIESNLIISKEKPYPVFQNRVMFPIHDVQGNLIAFSGRKLDDTENKYPKYVNSTFEKGKHLYALNIAKEHIQRENKAYLMEGYMDVIRFHGKGIKNAVANCGTALTVEQVKLIKRFADTVVIVPDNDLGKWKEAKDKGEKPVNAGLEAMEKWAKVLLSEGMIVKVLIPGSTTDKIDNYDPDNWLIKLRTQQKIEEWLSKERDYIEDYKVLSCMELGQAGSVEKSNQIKELEETLNYVASEKLRGIYYDSIVKTFPDFKKSVSRPKIKQESTIQGLEKLGKASKEDYFEYGFFEEENYYKTYQNQKPITITNFVIEILYFVRGQETKYVCRLRNIHGKVVICAIPVEYFASKTDFKKHLLRQQNFIFFGTQEHLDRIASKLFKGVKQSVQPSYIGYNPNWKGFIWANGIFYKDRFIKSDKYGIVEIEKPIQSLEEFKAVPRDSRIIINGEDMIIEDQDAFYDDENNEAILKSIESGSISVSNYYFLPFSTTLKVMGEDEEDDNYQFERYFKYKHDPKTNFKDWAKMYADCYHDSGKVAIVYYVMSIFRDIIFKANNNWVPLLGFFGEKESGKSTAARSLVRMYGQEPTPDGINLEGGSTSTGVRRYMSAIQNGIIWLNEYKNSLPPYTLGMIKGLADGSGKLTGRHTGGNETKVSNPKSTAILCGQDLPTKDPAIFSRVIPCEFDKKNRNRAAYEKLMDWEQKQVGSTITCELLKYRNLIEKNYAEFEPTVAKYFRELFEFKEMASNDRLIRNLTSIFTPFRILEEHLDFPFTAEELSDILIEKARLQIEVQNTTDDVEQYLNIIQSLIANHKVQEDKDYMIKSEPEGLRFYIRPRDIHPFYRQMAQQTGMASMDLGTLQSYLKKHSSFVEYKKNGVRFPKLKTRTSAYVMDYGKLIDQDIQFAIDNEILANEINDMLPSEKDSKIMK